MRIAVVSTPFIRVPPHGYGGTELFCAHLAEGLLRRGHHVSLFATGDSEFRGDLRYLVREAQWPPSDTVEQAHMAWALSEIANDGEFDAVQINSPCGLSIARDLGVSVICTLHSAPKASESRVFAAHPEAFYVAISARQLELEGDLRRASVIHHGIDVAEYSPSPSDEGYVLHLGRFAGEKGTHRAIDAARLAGVPIVLAGRVHDEHDEFYFDRELRPRFGLPGVTVQKEADLEEKVRLLRGAKALLCPIDWEEPFGLVAIEAMLTGTPVLGFPRGSFPEIVDEGVTGRLVRDVAEMATAIRGLDGWDRLGCSQHAASRFSSTRMTEDYERLMLSLAEDTPRLARASGVFPVPKIGPARLRSVG